MKVTNKTSDNSPSKIPTIIISPTPPKPPNGSLQHPQTITKKILLKTYSSPHVSYKSPTTFLFLKPIGLLMLPTRKTTNQKISTSNLNPLKLSISERKVPFGCGFGSESSPLPSSRASSSSKDGLMKTITDTRDHHHSCTQMRTIPQMQKISWSSKLRNTTSGGTQVFSRDRNFMFNVRYMKIEDGKKIYFKHAGVNQPA